MTDYTKQQQAAMQKEYSRKWLQKPENRKKVCDYMREYRKTDHWQAWHKEYLARPEIKERRRLYAREYQRRKREEAKAARMKKEETT